MSDTTSPDPYRIRSQATWDAARKAYLDGEAAEAVCARFDIGLSAFRTRSRKEGWRRADQPDPDPCEPIDTDEDALGQADPATLAALAWRHLGRALSRGRAAEAQRWLRVHAQLAQPERVDDRIREAKRNGYYEGLGARAHGIKTVAKELVDNLNRQVGGLEDLPDKLNLHDLHDLHPENLSPSPNVSSASRPLSRAERRRQARLTRHPTGPSP